MNPVRRFFRRYVLSTVGLLALLLAANILLIVGLLLISRGHAPAGELFHHGVLPAI